MCRAKGRETGVLSLLALIPITDPTLPGSTTRELTLTARFRFELALARPECR